MTSFEWQEKHNTGINDLDEQHKKLAEFTQKLAGLSKEEQPNLKIVQRAVILLGAYARAHTSYEEDLLLKKHNNYISNESKDADEEIFSFLEAIKDELNKGEVNKELLEMLHIATSNWLTNHIDFNNKTISKAKKATSLTPKSLPLLANLAPNRQGYTPNPL